MNNIKGGLEAASVMERSTPFIIRKDAQIRDFIYNAALGQEELADRFPVSFADEGRKQF